MRASSPTGLTVQNHLALGIGKVLLACGLTLALTGALHAPRSGNLLLRVRDEQPVMPHGSPANTFEASAVEALAQAMATKAVGRPVHLTLHPTRSQLREE
jgi:hypothetical protein